MFDARIRPLIDPPLNRAGRWLAARGISANALTLCGLACGLLAAAAIATGHMALAVVLVLASRLLDGLDGAVARATARSAFGGYLDIVADFLFYVSVPLAFALLAPGNWLPAAVLLAGFALTGVSFLALASVAAESGLSTTAHGQKSFFYSTGLAEGGETIAFFIAMCVWPERFPHLAAAFALLCGATVFQRTLLARHLLRGS
jgi:phosphatidylglycerophosphate synthase